MAWEKKLLLISQFLPSCSGSACQMALKRKDSYQGDLSLWWLMRKMSRREGRADPEMRSAKRTTLCRALQSWLEALHFLWPLNRKFSGLLVRPRISSAVADGTVFAWLSWPVFECVQSKSVPQRCLHQGIIYCLYNLLSIKSFKQGSTLKLKEIH